MTISKSVGMNAATFKSGITKIIDDFKLKNIGDNEYAAHYTSADVPKLILEGENVLRQYDGDYMNDPEEGRYLIEVLIDAADKSSHAKKDIIIGELNKLRRTKILYSAYQKATFLSCWTRVKLKAGQEEGSDSLNHWRFYGRDGAGACIMVPLKQLDLIFPDQMFEVEYGLETRGGGLAANTRTINQLKPLLIQRFNTLKSTPSNLLSEIAQLIQDIHPLLFLIKTSDYASEKEVRSIVHKANYSQSSGVLFDQRGTEPSRAYIESLKPIIPSGSIIYFGPKADPKRAIEILGVADAAGFQIKSFVSTMPYR